MPTRAQQIADLGNNVPLEVFHALESVYAQIPLVLDGAPSENDDSAGTAGNGPVIEGTVAIDTSQDPPAIYSCADATATGAVWNQLYPAPAGLSNPLSGDLSAGDNNITHVAQLNGGGGGAIIDVGNGKLVTPSGFPTIDWKNSLLVDSSNNPVLQWGAPGVMKLPNIPTTDPHVAGQVWSNLGILTLSAG